MDKPLLNFFCPVPLPRGIPPVRKNDSAWSFNLVNPYCRLPTDRAKFNAPGAFFSDSFGSFRRGKSHSLGMFLLHLPEHPIFQLDKVIKRLCLILPAEIVQVSFYFNFQHFLLSPFTKSGADPPQQSPRCQSNRIQSSPAYPCSQHTQVVARS